MKLIHGDSLEILPSLQAESVHAVVTDPPYGLGFMGKQWDSLPPGEIVAKELLRVLRPGGHLLAFGGTRTYHRLTCALEDAGFEIRDCLAWIYGSGFPKSLNLDGDHDGWGTALKPAHEPIVMARKPLSGTVAANVERYGTGALNISASRIAAERLTFSHRGKAGAVSKAPKGSGIKISTQRDGEWINDSGRWPANILLGHGACCGEECGPCCAVAELDRQSGELSSGSRKPMVTNGLGGMGRYGSMPNAKLPAIEGDSGGASRFFYTAKASTSEKNAGLEGMKKGLPVDGRDKWTERDRRLGDGVTASLRENVHPTVKPIDLMRWLCRLVTPPGGTVLDPFMGSGTTGIAALREGFDFMGVEREKEYFEIAVRRIEEDAPLFRRGKSEGVQTC